MKSHKYDRKTIKHLLNAYFKIEKELKAEDPTFHIVLGHAIRHTYLPFAKGRNVTLNELNYASHRIILPLIERCRACEESDTLLKVWDIMANLFPIHFTFDELLDKNESELCTVEARYLQAIGFKNT